MSERRYRDNEVRRILELATRPEAARPRPATTADGLTLADIQSIAVEVGVEPDAIARAAATLDASRTTGRRTSWGMPIEVGRTIPLPRALTDHEWDRLVAELRATFRARGKVTMQGGLREWSNGNLHASVEPAENGYRLRLGTLKGDAAGVNALGATGMAAGAVVLGVAAFSGGTLDAIFGPAILAVSGASAIAANLIRLPRWANQRQRQMEHIVTKVRAMTADSEPSKPEN